METTNLLTVKKSPKNIGIEMLKFFAAIIIVNSHMGDLYVCFPQLATGGAIGDAIFFFCSGYGLFLAQKRKFWNYYKRRIGRIYPSVFAWAILSAFFLGESHDMKHTILFGGGWFVSCIMVYYVFFWFIHCYLLDKLQLVLWGIFMISMTAFLIYDRSYFINIYGGGISRFIFFFGYMLLGGIIGYSKKRWYFKSPVMNIISLLLSVIFFYGIIFVSSKLNIWWQVQFLSLLPLAGIVLFLFGLCETVKARKLFHKYRLFGFVGGLCLEMYIVQFTLFTTKMNGLFPLNLFLMLIIVILSAYLLRCSARLFESFFRTEDINWKKVIAI